MLGPMVYRTPTYEFLIRNPRTFALLGELPPADIESAQWSRHQYRPGEWRLTIPRVAADRAAAAAGVDLLSEQNMLEILRDGAVEFQGYILTDALDRENVARTVGGYCLRDWLGRRYIGSGAAEEASGVGETELKALVTAHLGSGAAANRQATGELLGGKTFTVEADAGRGAVVAYKAQRRVLSDVLADICEQAGLLHDVVLTSAGLEYRVSEPTDATQGTSGSAWSVALDNTDGIGWQVDRRAIANALYVAGTGSGDTRTVRTVRDETSIAQHFLREGVLNVPAATSNDQLDAMGAAEIARQDQAAISALVQPIKTSLTARYRTDWDVGWDITVDLPFSPYGSIDRRIVAASVELRREDGERITMALGAEAPSVVKRIERKFAQVDGALSV